MSKLDIAKRNAKRSYHNNDSYTRPIGHNYSQIEKRLKGCKTLEDVVKEFTTHRKDWRNR